MVQPQQPLESPHLSPLKAEGDSLKNLITKRGMRGIGVILCHLVGQNSLLEITLCFYLRHCPMVPVCR